MATAPVRRKATSRKSVAKIRKPPQPVNQFQDAMAFAHEIGLLKGARTRIVRGRMPEALVKQAKANSGIKSDTELLEVALANLAVADKYMEWLVSRAGSVPKDIDLEY